MNRVCRQVAALGFATGMMLHLRWIPSEPNPSDLPSRAQDVKAFDLRQGLRDLQVNYDSKERKGETGWRKSAIISHCGHAKCQRAQTEPLGADKEAPPHPSAGASECHQGGEDTSSKGREGAVERAKLHGERPGLATAGQKSFLKVKAGGGSTQVLCEGLDGVEGLGSHSSPQHRVQTGSRQCSGEQAERDALRRPRHRRCHDPACGGQISSTGHRQDGEVGEVNRCPDRVSQVRPSTEA